MHLTSHPLISRVLEAGEAFRAGSLSAEQLQLVVSANMSALEGDVPSTVRDAMFQLEADIDSARFATSTAERPGRISRSLEEFESALSGTIGPSQAPS